MSREIRTMSCYPVPLKFGPFTCPAPEPDHERCGVAWHMPGLIGGWHCPCPCHRKAVPS